MRRIWIAALPCAVCVWALCAERATEPPAAIGAVVGGAVAADAPAAVPLPERASVGAGGGVDRAGEERVRASPAEAPEGQAAANATAAREGDERDPRDAIAAVRSYGAAEGLVVPEHGLSLAAQRALVVAHDALLADGQSIHAERAPVVQAVAEHKRERGAFELVKTSRNMPPRLSRDEQKQWRREAAAARQPTTAGQVVVTTTVDGKAALIRVDLGDDARLRPLHECSEQSRRRFVEEARRLLASER